MPARTPRLSSPSLPRPLASLALVALCAAACGPGRQRDAAVEDAVDPGGDVLEFDVVVRPSETGTTDPEAGAEASLPGRDGGGPLPDGAPAEDVFVPSFDDGVLPLPDVMVPSGMVMDPGPCTVQGAPVVLGAEMRARSRPVHTIADSRGFAFAAAQERMGAENVWLQRIAPDGVTSAEGPISDLLGTTRMVRGGAIVTQGEFFNTVYTADGAVFIAVGQSNARPIARSQTMVAPGSEAADAPQVIALAEGYLVAWRSGTRLRGARLDSAREPMGAAFDLSPAGTAVAAFALAAQAEPFGAAVAFRAGNELRVQRLGANGSPSGDSVVAASGDLGDGVGAAVRGGEVITVWNEPRAGGTLRVRRVPATGAPPAAVDLGMRTQSGAMPGVALDGDGYAVGFRARVGGLDAVGLARLDGALAVRNVSYPAAAGAGGPVGVAARTENAYALGWADDLPSGTVTRAVVLRCP